MFIRVIRNLAGIVVGYFIFAMASTFLFLFYPAQFNGLPSIPFIIISTLVGIIFAFAGGFVAMVITGENNLVNSMILPGMMALIALVSLISMFGKPSIWSPISVLVFMTPSAFGGGYFRLKRKK